MSDFSSASASLASIAGKSQPAAAPEVASCKHFNQLCPFSTFSAAQVRKWEANSFCPSRSVELEVPEYHQHCLKTPS
jgi:hypothetical protein